MHPFIVGERYADRRGEYTVVGIDGDRIRYRYDNGMEVDGNIEDKARIYANILGELRTTFPHQSNGYFWFLGFLSQHGEFQAEVPPQSRAAFEERYVRDAGVEPVVHQDGYYPIEIETTYDKWAPELRIYFPIFDDPIDLPEGVEVRAANDPGKLRINNNSFWWQLVRIGFRLGTHHDVERIAAAIPRQYQESFQGGTRFNP